MIYTELRLAGIFLIKPEPRRDDRGFFARVCDRDEFEARGLKWQFSQCSISFNENKGTLRGMHYQVAPHEEAKLVRCTMGAIFDVVIDLRPGSATFRQWVSVELSEENRRLLYIPEGLAHGFQTLTANAEVSYQISVPYVPEAARGVRWDDPAFAIEWAVEVSIISARDRSFPDSVSSERQA